MAKKQPNSSKKQCQKGQEHSQQQGKGILYGQEDGSQKKRGAPQHSCEGQS